MYRSYSLSRVLQSAIRKVSDIPVQILLRVALHNKGITTRVYNSTYRSS